MQADVIHIEDYFKILFLRGAAQMSIFFFISLTTFAFSQTINQNASRETISPAQSQSLVRVSTVCSYILKILKSHNVKKRTCAPSEDSDQPADSRSLIRIFTARIFDSQMMQSLFMLIMKTLIRLRRGKTKKK